MSDLFDVQAGEYLDKDSYTKGTTPYVTASGLDNGISESINHDPIFEGNKVTVGKVGCVSYYQPNPFCATSDVNVLTPKFEMSANVGLFIATIITYSQKDRWGFGRQCRIRTTNNLEIRLPVLSQETKTPDWQLIECYMRTVNLF